jgi:Beta-propeller repeat
MTSKPRALVFASFLLIALSTASFRAQTAPKHALTFAELTYGTTINAMAADGQGGVWFAGNTCSTALPTTANAVQRTASSGCHGMVGRMKPDGSVTYLSYLGGSRGSDYANALVLDRAGNVYIGGWTTAPDFPTTPDAYDGVCGDDGTCTINKFVGQHFILAPAADGFLTKLTPAGDRIAYSTFVGGRDDDAVTGVAIDAAGRLHLAGTTISTDFPVTAGALQTAFSPGADPDGGALTDAFYVRLGGAGGALQYGTYLGGYGSEWTTGVVVDGSGDAYVGGTTTSENFPVLNAPRPRNTSTASYPYTSADGFLARFAAGGAVYATYVGGSDGDYGYAIGLAGSRVFLAGQTCSRDFPGVSDPNVNECAAYIAEVPAATGAVDRTVTMHTVKGFDRVLGMSVDVNHVAYVTGLTVATSTSTYPTTSDAYQRSFGGRNDAFFSIVDMSGETPVLSYATYLGGNDEEAGYAVAPDGAGGAFFGGASRVFGGETSSFPSHTTQPQPAAEPPPNQNQSFAAHVSIAQDTGGTSGPEIVLHARDASAIAGAWRLVADATAAGGTRAWLPDAGVAKLSAPAASPANYFELTFDAQAGVPYHLWLRMKADADSWQNDSVFVQFSDSIDASGNPVWRKDTTSATVVSLEDCSGCGEHGWGWNDNGYGTAGALVTFGTSGTHTIRIQQREDGISVDQIVLSAHTYLNDAPGANKDDATIVDPSAAPEYPNEVVVYGADVSAAAGAWQFVSDATAAGGRRLWQPDAGAGKIATASASPTNYFDVTFTAKAGVPYHLWLRMKADADSWQNDSVFVQFSDSIDASGNPLWRKDTTSATVVSLEDCSGCGVHGWGWNDNGYGTPGALVTFATSGSHTIRIQQREDGISIDQIVLSAVKYLNQAPGAAKDDAAIIAK